MSTVYEAKKPRYILHRNAEPFLGFNGLEEAIKHADEYQCCAPDDHFAITDLRPWADADAFEAWVIKIDGEEILCRSDIDGDFTPIFGHPKFVTLANGSDKITRARRIWPEEAGDGK